MIATLALSIGILVADKPYTLIANDIPTPTVKKVVKALEEGVSRVERYFGESYRHKFPVIVVPHRADFDHETARLWKMPASEKWMVGAGGANVLLILSPDAWKAEAVEHDSLDPTELNQIIAHELTHVYHAQLSPKKDFEEMDEMGWFVEGLAVLVSGQLEARHSNASKRAIAQGKAPTSLDSAWSGPFRYGVSGSIVKFIADKWGKPTVKAMMRLTSNKEALKALGTTEFGLLNCWRYATSKSD